MCERTGMSFLSFIKKNLPRSSRCLGLTLGHAALQLVELEKKGENYLLHHYSRTSFPAENFSFSHPAFVDFLKQTFDAYNITAQRVVVGLPHSAVLCKTISLDKNITEAEIAVHIRSYAEQYFHYPVSELSMDFELLGLSPENADLRLIRWVAARRIEVEAALHALQKAGMSVQCIETDAYALCRLACYYLQKHSVDTSFHALVLYLYEHAVLFTLIQNGQCQHMHIEDYAPDASFSAILQGVEQIFTTIPKITLSCILLAGQDLSDDLREKIEKSLEICTQKLEMDAFLENTEMQKSREIAMFSIPLGLAMQEFVWE